MPYLNLDLDYFSHPKTIRLVCLLGRGAEVMPIKLWNYCGKFHTEDGMLAGYSTQEIETILGWWGLKGQALEVMEDVGFIRKNGNGWEVVDWLKHQGHLAAFKARSIKANKKRWADYRREKRLSHKESLNDPARSPKRKLKESSVPSLTVPDQTKEILTPPQPGGGENPARRDEPREATPLQKTVLGFKVRMGVAADDRGWDALYFPRFSKPAKELLTLFDGDVGRALDCIEAVADALDRQKLGWTPETIVKHAGSWKGGTLFK
jgi:hypothetical protein